MYGVRDSWFVKRERGKGKREEGRANGGEGTGKREKRKEKREEKRESPFNRLRAGEEGSA